MIAEAEENKPRDIPSLELDVVEYTNEWSLGEQGLKEKRVNAETDIFNKLWLHTISLFLKSKFVTSLELHPS